METKINGRGIAVLREIRAIAGDKIDEKTGEVLVKKEDWSQYHVRISTVNTFPTGAGLASSAAGLACLVATLAKLYSVVEKYPGQLTAIARQGSGSASRSMYGGFVRWQEGERADATDSIAVQIADEKVSGSMCPHSRMIDMCVCVCICVCAFVLIVLQSVMSVLRPALAGNESDHPGGE